MGKIGNCLKMPQQNSGRLQPPYRNPCPKVIALGCGRLNLIRELR